MKEVNLLLTGSFNPVTLVHLRMLEIARDHLREQDIVVTRAFMSPVHDSYGKPGLIPVAHRAAMLKLALESSDWIELSLWESQQPSWTRTYEVLQHHKNVVLESSESGRSAKKKKLTNATTSKDVNDNPNEPVHVMFMCGGDNIAEFSNPNIWAPEDIEKILVEHGLAVVTRVGFDIDCIIYESDLLYKHKKHITVVREFIHNEVSSTKIRVACSRGLSIKYLVPEKVEQYIRKHKLYCSESKYERIESDFRRINRTSVKPVIETPIVSENSSRKESDLVNDKKVGRFSRRSKNIMKRSKK